MKRIISIVLSVAMLITLLSITATAETIDNISVEFDPRVGESIISKFDATLNEDISTNCYIEYKFSGAAVTAFTSAEIKSLEDIDDFCDEHTPLSASEYEEQDYLFVFTLWLDGDEANTPTINSTDETLTGYPLFVDDDNTLYFYFKFSLEDSESNDNTNTNIGNSSSNSSNSGTATGASNTLSSNGTQNIDVNAKYQSTGEEATVYSVVIEWGSMQFTYNSEFVGTWNPETHGYDEHKDAVWTYEPGANAITVTNHSNTKIQAGFTYKKNAGFADVTGSFLVGNSEINAPVEIETAVETARDNAPSLTALLELSGKLPESAANGVTCGVVTVTIY